MIPAGRTPVDAEQAARICGMALKTALNRKLFDQPGFPEALTRGKRKRLWDEEQVYAYAAGQPIPAIPPSAPHPDDLLERGEAAEQWGITPQTWDDYLVKGYAPSPDKVIGGRELWYRRTLQSYRRPGRGVTDTVRPRSERLAQVAAVIKEFGGDASADDIIKRIVEVTGLSVPHARRLLREMQDRGQAQPRRG